MCYFCDNFAQFTNLIRPYGWSVSPAVGSVSTGGQKRYGEECTPSYDEWNCGGAVYS